MLDGDNLVDLHDAPAKAAFAEADPALSHGRARVKDIEGLADE